MVFPRAPLRRVYWNPMFTGLTCLAQGYTTYFIPSMYCTREGILQECYQAEKKLIERKQGLPTARKGERYQGENM